MPYRRSRGAALMAVMALVLAIPFQRGRDCDVCPVDCPMHAARKGPERPIGCHHGASTPRPAPPVDDGACAMRSSCGHHGKAAVPVFAAELPPAFLVNPVVARRFAAPPDGPMHVADGPPPPYPPPETSVV